MHHIVERIGGGGDAWAQQRWKFLEQLLYLWQECGGSAVTLAAVSGLQALMK
jgi:hypothetical protein